MPQRHNYGIKAQIFSRQSTCWDVFLKKDRPVSLTSIPGKVVEQLILGTITRHMKDKVTGNGQHGFTKGKSCLTNLTTFYDEMTGLVGEGREVGITYLDFYQVFDIVSCKILIGKLMKYGLDE